MSTTLNITLYSTSALELKVVHYNSFSIGWLSWSGWLMWLLCLSSLQLLLLWPVLPQLLQVHNLFTLLTPLSSSVSSLFFFQELIVIVLPHLCDNSLWTSHSVMLSDHSVFFLVLAGKKLQGAHKGL